MKWLVKILLKIFPRSFLQRVAGWGVPLLGLFYVGRGKECPICGCRRRKFLPYGYVTQRENALCPKCLSLERHRMIWLYLKEHTDLFDLRPQLLHIAPEVALMKPLRRIYTEVPERYQTADLESPLADMHFDIQHIPLQSESCEVIFCNHILEHVEDDGVALAELYRIMRPGGWGIILSPVDIEREHTFEDDSVSDPAERTRLFGQYDHRRVYGRDYVERLAAAGFEVEDIDFSEQLSEGAVNLYALSKEHLYIVRKR
ncbi:MAG: class I SAM-dependent methyltransferase [Alistipes sp.]|nr:class I SAM-dependent methyltransferase [Alistipes sp.]